MCVTHFVKVSDKMVYEKKTTNNISCLFIGTCFQFVPYVEYVMFTIINLFSSQGRWSYRTNHGANEHFWSQGPSWNRRRFKRNVSNLIFRYLVCSIAVHFYDPCSFMAKPIGPVKIQIASKKITRSNRLIRFPRVPISRDASCRFTRYLYSTQGKVK